MDSNVQNDTQLKTGNKKCYAVYAPTESPVVSPFDPRQSGKLTRAQLSALEALHQNCALRMSDSLGLEMRSAVEVSLTSIEQVSGAELLDRIADPSYLLFLHTSFGATALLQFDLSLVFTLLDVLLGGSAVDSPEPRALTEIEYGILDPVGRDTARAIQEGWESAIVASFQMDRAAQKKEVSSRLPVGDRLLAVTFQIRFQKAEGRLLAVFPAQASAALLRKLETHQTDPAPAPSLDHRKVQEHLLESTFNTELLLPKSLVSFRQLSNLQVGDVLLLEVPASTQMEIRVAGQYRFMAAPVRCGNKRGAQVTRILSIVPEEEEKKK
jgi:flagellar motor switch protein FliM